MYIVSELEKDFSVFNYLSLKFIVFVLFQMDQFFVFNVKEIEDKVQSTIY